MPSIPETEPAKKEIENEPASAREDRKVTIISQIKQSESLKASVKRSAIPKLKPFDRSTL